MKSFYGDIFVYDEQYSSSNFQKIKNKKMQTQENGRSEGLSFLEEASITLIVLTFNKGLQPAGPLVNLGKVILFKAQNISLQFLQNLLYSCCLEMFSKSIMAFGSMKHANDILKYVSNFSSMKIFSFIFLLAFAFSFKFLLLCLKFFFWYSRLDGWN